MSPNVIKRNMMCTQCAVIEFSIEKAKKKQFLKIFEIGNEIFSILYKWIWITNVKKTKAKWRFNANIMQVPMYASVIFFVKWLIIFVVVVVVHHFKFIFQIFHPKKKSIFHFSLNSALYQLAIVTKLEYLTKEKEIWRCRADTYVWMSVLVN